MSIAACLSDAGDDEDDDMAPRNQTFKLFTGNGNPQLSAEIAERLGLQLGGIRVGKFSDGETAVQIQESVRGESVYIIQPTCAPVNDNLMELLLMTSALRRASAKQITAVIPYYGYKRDVGTPQSGSSQRDLLQQANEEDEEVGVEDENVECIVPISSAEVATMLEAMGVDHVISVDLQAPGQGQIEGFFGTRVPVDSIEGTFAGVEYFRKRVSDRVTIVAANETLVKKASDFQAGLRGSGYRWRNGALRKTSVGLAIVMLGSDLSRGSRHIRSRRKREVTTDDLMIVGDVDGHDVIIVDDMIASGGTICARAKMLREAGARRIYVFATHGVFSGNALERIGRTNELDEVVVTNTIPLPPSADRRSRGKVVHISIADVIGDVISKIHKKQSLRNNHLTVYQPLREDGRFEGQSGE